MPSVDNRVVEMRFDNKDFEGGISTSLDSLEKLKKSLKLKDAAKGFEDLDKASKKIDFSVIQDACEAVTRKFSFMGTVWDQTIRNMTNKANELASSVTRLVKSMSVDQVTAGWNKYEQKTGSVQTILNATGLSIDEVNEQLERLQWYSDETSFGFTDMTSALQTMTSSGGELDKLIPMIMGIGNATAFAGKGAGEFSRIMYNLNQAYGMGYLGTMDWRSVELAGASSKQLKQTLIDVTKELGKGSYTLETFSDALTDKVFDKEVMEKAFGRFAEVTLEAEKLVSEGIYDTASDAYEHLSTMYHGVAMDAATAAQEAKTFAEAIDATKDAVSTGWMETWEHVFGNYEEAKSLWTWLANELWDMFASGAEDRNEMLKKWHDGIKLTGNLAEDLQNDFAAFDGLTWDAKEGMNQLSGYQMFIASIHNMWEGIEGIVQRGKDILSSVIPPLTYERLMNLTETFYHFSEKFRDAFAVVEDFIEPIGDALEPVQEALEPVETAIDNLRTLDEIAQAVINGDYGNEPVRFAKLLEEGINPELVQNRVNELMGDSYVNDLIHGTSLYLNETAESIESVSDATGEANAEVKKTPTILQSIVNILRGAISVFGLVKRAASAFWSTMALPAIQWFGNNVLPSILASFGSIGTKISTWAESLTKEKLEEKFQGIADWVANAGTNLQDLYKKARQMPEIAALIDRFVKLRRSVKLFAGTAWENIKNFFTNTNFGGVWSNISSGALNILGKISGAVVNVWDLLSPKLSSIGDWLLHAGTNLGNLYKKIRRMPAVAKLVDKFVKLRRQLKTSAGSIWESISSFFGGIDLSGSWDTISEKVSNAIGKIADAIVSVWDYLDSLKGLSIGEIFEKIKNDILSKFDVESFSELFDNLIANLKSKWASILEFFTGNDETPNLFERLFGKKEDRTEVEETVGLFDTLKEKLGGFLDSITPGKIALVLGLAAALGAIFGVYKLSESLGSTFSNINGFLDRVTGKDIVAPAKKGIPILLQLSIVIGTIAGAIYLLSTVDSEKLAAARGTLLVLLGVITVMGLVFWAIGKWGMKGEQMAANMTSLGVSMLAISGAVLLLALALAALNFVNLEGLGPKLAALGAVFAAVTGVSLALGRFKGGSIKDALSMLIFAFAVGKMVSVLEKLAKADLSGLKDNLGDIVVAIGILAGLSFASRGSSLSAGLGVTVMLANIMILVHVLEKLSEIPLSTLTTGRQRIWGLVAILGSLALALRLAGGGMNTVVKEGKNVTKSKSNILSVGLALLAMSAALLLITKAVAQIGDLPEEDFKQGIAGVSIILAFFAAITGLSHFAGKGMIGVGTSIILMSVAMLIIGQAIKQIGKIPTKDFKQGAKAVAGMMIFMVAFSAISRLGKIKFGEMVTLVLGIALAMGIMLGAFYLLKNMFTDDPELFTTLSDGLSKMMAALSFLAIAMKFGGASNISTAVAKIIAVFGAFAILLASTVILGLLAKIPGFVTVLEQGAELMGTLGGAIGKFVNGFLNAIGIDLSGFTLNLDTILTGITTALDNFTTNIQPFTDYMGTNGGTLASAAWDMVKFMTSVGLLKLTGNLFGLSSIGDFAQELADSNFGTNFGSFVDSIKDIDEDQAESIGIVGTIAQQFVDIQKTMKGFDPDSFLGLILGLGNFGSFGRELSVFGPSFKIFANSVKDITPEQIDAMSNVAGVTEKFVSIQETMNGFEPDSVMGWIKGLGNFKDLGGDLFAFGPNFMLFANSVKDITPEQIDAMSKVGGIAQQFVNIKGQMEGFNPDSVSGFILGIGSLKELGQELGSGGADSFGANFAAFGREVEQITPEQINSMSKIGDIADKMVEIKDRMVGFSEDFSLAGLVLGIGTYTAFGQELSALGTAMNTYSGELSDVDYDSLSQAATVLSEYITLKNLIGGDPTLFTPFSDSLKTLGNNLSYYGGIVLGIDWDAMNTAAGSLSLMVEAISSMSDIDGKADSSKGVSAFGTAMKNLGEVSVDGFLEAFDATETDATEKGNTLVQYVSTGISDNLETITSAGTRVTNQFALGLVTNLLIVTAAAKSVALTAKNQLTSGYSSAFSSGKNVAKGFADGISAYKYLALRAAREMARETKQAIDNTMEIESPSKVTQRQGMYTALGFAKGITDYSFRAEDAADSMATSALAGMNDVVTRIMDAINGDFDDSPVIRPVLDLSDVQNGANTLNGMFGARYGFSASLAYANNAARNIMASQSSSFDTGFSDAAILAELRSMRTDIQTLSDSMSEFQMVTDTGALVGQISRKMDSALGRIQKQRRRGL